MKPLTNNEQKILYFLKDTTNWRIPTYKVMREYLGLESDGYVSYLLKSLKNKGKLDSNWKPLKDSEDNAS